jgi:plastocyanin
MRDLGCGISGPVLAMFLRRAGLEPVVYEGRPEPNDEAGYFLSLAPNGVAGLDALGVKDQVLGLGIPTTSIVFQNHRGKRLGELPDTPMQMVREGDLMKTTFVNRSFMDHPMHLHGHHVLVLSRNGEPVSGSPWWADTLNVAPGESYEVAFRADNPGIWMDHCHTLDHAAEGMTMHLGYEGVTTPFEAGRATGNRPE